MSCPAPRRARRSRWRPALRMAPLAVVPVLLGALGGCVGGGPEGAEPPAWVAEPAPAALPDPLVEATVAVLSTIAGADAPSSLPREALIQQIVDAGEPGLDPVALRAAAVRLVDAGIAAVVARGPAHGSALQAQAVRGVAAQMARGLRGGGAPPAVDVPGGVGQLLSWSTLGGFSYTEGMALPAAVLALDGQRVSVQGALLPLEEVEGEVWYLLVESLWDCCFGKPPELHQAMVARLHGQSPRSGQVVQVTGTLSVGEDRDADGYVSSVYRLDAAQVVPLP